MTKLILDPFTLNDVFPDASVKKNYRFRLLAQCMGVDRVNRELKVCKIPRSNQESNTVTVSLDKVDYIKTFDVGDILDLIGYYDGENLDIYEVNPVDGRDIMNENYNIVERMTNLQDI